jgi:ribosomal protein L6P/L9E
MSHIGLNTIPYSRQLINEIQLYKTFSVIWLSGCYQTWKFLLEKPFILRTKNQSISVILPYFYKVASQFRKKTDKILMSTWSLTSVKLQKFVKSAKVGFKAYLRIIGVGYKFFITENKPMELKAQGGFTHLLVQNLHPSFTIKFTRKSRMIKLRSSSLSRLTNDLACLRNKSKPNVFTGKGIKFRSQKVFKKSGKKKRI